jgi:hypothetical protein
MIYYIFSFMEVESLIEQAVRNKDVWEKRKYE